MSMFTRGMWRFGFLALSAVYGTTLYGAGTATIAVDVGNAGPPFAPELFGVAWNWTENGGGVIEYGELIRDRSFRNQSDARARAWNESPNKAGGDIDLIADGGDDKPISGEGYPGYYRMKQQQAGGNCISQVVREGVASGAQYDLNLSARAEEGQPQISAFFADDKFNPIQELTAGTAIASAAWSGYSFVLVPTRTVATAYVMICQATAGVLGVDEIRLHQRGDVPHVRADADAKIRALGVRSLRWPTGSDADYFDWAKSIGPLLQRGENPSAFGVVQTPSLGLHEFLNYCASHGIVPLITVNVREAPSHAADLVEYILGPTTSTMGALRTRNGHPAPWDVRYFELGNEPVDVYRGEHDKSDAAKGYVEGATAIAVAMRERAQAMGRTINLQGVLETTFAAADWLFWAPMLAHWNEAVLAAGSTLRPHLDQVKGNFYSAFNHRDDDNDLFAEVMGGGTTIAGIARSLNEHYGPLPPFWITEYSVMVQKKKLLFGSEIQLDRTNDYQAGMGVADILLSAINANFGGAYMFNLAARGTWGVLENNLQNHAVFDVGPAGLAFSMISPLAGLHKVPLTIDGSDTITLTKGDGVSPAKTRYTLLEAVAGASQNGVELVVLNRSVNQPYKLAINLKGFSPSRADVYTLKSQDLRAKNIDDAARVSIEHSSQPASSAHELEIAPKSLLRVSYTKG